MSEKTVIITETADGGYRIQNNGISEYALIGILECVVFDLKTAKRDASPIKTGEIVHEQKETVIESTPVPEPNRENVPESKTPDLRTRISNAVKAIRSLGGEVEENVDRTNATDKELQTELEELTNQYKRLKSSKGK
jgi:hypothetical protein